jgi:hypothetical protein
MIAIPVVDRRAFLFSVDPLQRVWRCREVRDLKIERRIFMDIPKDQKIL